MCIATLTFTKYILAPDGLLKRIACQFLAAATRPMASVTVTA